MCSASSSGKPAIEPTQRGLGSGVKSCSVNTPVRNRMVAKSLWNDGSVPLTPATAKPKTSEKCSAAPKFTALTIRFHDPLHR